MAKKLKSRVGDQGSRIGLSQGPAQADPDALPPKFCLRNLQSSHCITACNEQERAAFAYSLFKLSRLPWQELRQAPRHGLGYEKIARVSIRCGIPATVSDDVQLIAFRFSGMKAMVGFRSGDGVFKRTVGDRDFTVYHHQ
jgi:hypothetical protein